MFLASCTDKSGILLGTCIANAAVFYVFLFLVPSGSAYCCCLSNPSPYIFNALLCRVVSGLEISCSLTSVL